MKKLLIAMACSLVTGAAAHDAARPDLGPWFDQLKSNGKAMCCSNKDGMMLADVDWDIKKGHYRVRLENKWWDVPDEAVVTEPNQDGRTMVWPIYYHSMGGEDDHIGIRCFMPGSMT